MGLVFRHAPNPAHGYHRNQRAEGAPVEETHTSPLDLVRAACGLSGRQALSTREAYDANGEAPKNQGEQEDDPQSLCLRRVHL